MNIRRRSSVFVFYIIACNTAIWRYENKRVNLFWRDEESQPFQRKYASYKLLPELATISWIACLLASAEGPVLHSLSPCQSSQVNWPQTLRGNYCTCSWSLSSINGEKMTSCARVYWICHFNSWISYPRLCFIAFQMKFNYPVPSHFQFSGRDGSGTWKKVRDGSGTGIPSDPGYKVQTLSTSASNDWLKIKRSARIKHIYVVSKQQNCHPLQQCIWVSQQWGGSG